MTGKVSVSRFSAWAPGIDGLDQWRQWAEGRRRIAESADAPALLWTDGLFRRRLSQISKMTAEVVKRLCPLDEETTLIFISFRGELERQFSLNKMLIEGGAITPAAFSLSVFNAPPALASIALSLKGGYSSVYPGNGSFASGFLSAAAALGSCGEGDIVFVYADECIREEYRPSVKGAVPPPLAFAALLSAEGRGESIDCGTGSNDLSSRESFLKKLIFTGNVVYAP